MFSAYVAGVSQPNPNVAREIRISQGPRPVKRGAKTP